MIRIRSQAELAETVPDIHQRVSVNSISTGSWSLERDLELWEQLGIERVGLPIRKLRPDIDSAMDRIGDSASVCVVALSRAFQLGRPDTYATDCQRLIDEVDVLRRHGVTTGYVTTGPSQSGMTVDESTTEFCAAIAPVVAHCRAIGFDLGVEPNSTMTHDSGCIHSLADALDVADETGLNVVVELQNCWLEAGLPATFRRGLDRFSVVQVSDFIVGTDVRLSRAVPGDGDIPIERLLGDLVDAGYSGIFDLEILGPRIETEGYTEAVTRGVRWLSACLDRLGVSR